MALAFPSEQEMRIKISFSRPFRRVSRRYWAAARIGRTSFSVLPALPAISRNGELRVLVEFSDPSPIASFSFDSPTHIVRSGESLVQVPRET